LISLKVKKCEKTNTWVPDDEEVVKILHSVDKMPKSEHQFYFRFAQLLLKDDKYLESC